MKLIDALRVDTPSKISFVGSGGKTSAMLHLSEEWPEKSLLAVTTHIGKNQIKNIPQHLTWSNAQEIHTSTIHKTTIITGPGDIQNENKLEGIDPSLWEYLKLLADTSNSPLFMESDGSKNRPLKAPAEHEPAIPHWVNHVVVTVGLSAIGKLLSEENVHRPEIYSTLTGLEIGRPVTLNSILKMLLNVRGGLKNIPRSARRTVLLNQADTVRDRSSLLAIETQLLTHFDAVITTSLRKPDEEKEESERQNEVWRVSEKIAGIILAAGNSKRMGTPKPLLEWKGIPFVRICALHAITAGLSPVHIIAGQEFDRIKQAVEDLPVQVIMNKDWNDGQSSSVRLGIKTLPKKTGGAVFLLVDQPQIPVDLIRKLVAEHTTSLSSIILPETGGRRANPVLFDRRTYHALSELQGDSGGRMIFSKYPIRSIPWYDETILLDVDTQADYERLMQIQT
jgi:molybdenum cofactor cytidylyltransferase